MSTPQSQTPADKDLRYRDLVRFKYIPTWILLGFIQLAGLIPLRMHRYLGYAAGKLLLVLIPGRRHVCEINLKKCFPEKSEAEIQSILKKAYTMYGMSILQTAFSWTRDSKQLENHFKIEGLDSLVLAQHKGRGVLLLGAHFALLEMAGCLLNRYVQFDMLQRINDNPLLNLYITRARERFVVKLIARHNIRHLIKRLKGGNIVCYFPDQDLDSKDSIFVPFFNIETATITATSKILKLTQSEVFGAYFYYDPVENIFVIQLEPIPIPTGDQVEDACIYNRWVEERIRRTPEQYFWLHKRFKTRPNGEASFY